MEGWKVNLVANLLAFQLLVASRSEVKEWKYLFIIHPFIDEFPEITALSHYPRIDDPLKLFRASLVAQPDVAVACAGSAVHAMEAMFTEHSSPLFLQFEMLSLAPFTREATFQLSNKLLDNLSSPAARQIHRLSFGHPFYVTAIAQRVRRMATAAVDTDTVRQAFILETLEIR